MRFYFIMKVGWHVGTDLDQIPRLQAAARSVAFTSFILFFKKFRPKKCVRKLKTILLAELRHKYMKSFRSDVYQNDNRKSKKFPEFWNRKNNLAIIAKHFEFSKIIKNQNR